MRVFSRPQLSMYSVPGTVLDTGRSEAAGEKPVPAGQELTVWQVRQPNKVGSKVGY